MPSNLIPRSLSESQPTSDSDSRTKLRKVSKLLRKPCLIPISTPLKKVSTQPVTVNAVNTAVVRKTVGHEHELSAAMRRILEQYRAGTYKTSDYSTRTVQRHHKYFIARNIDLSTPFVAQQPLNSKPVSALTNKSERPLDLASTRKLIVSVR